MEGLTRLNLAVFAAATVIAGGLLVGSGLPFLGGLAVSVAGFTVLWLVSLVISNASIVDIAWGPGFVVLGVFYLVSGSGAPTARALLVTLLVALWAIRLALHIGLRNVGAGEDFRYRRWRDESGRAFWWVSFFKVFLLQAVLLWIASSPLLLAQLKDPGAQLDPVDMVGVGLFLFGFGYEVVADWQLARFKRDPSNTGKVMRSGLWSRSRHPNYFGEAVLWWGLGLLAVPTGGWLALVGPVMITFLLLRISGVALLDAALVNRRQGYAEYIETTPAFFPRVLR
jgi:steroid 5-alpha reductase family enzyme